LKIVLVLSGGVGRHQVDREGEDPGAMMIGLVVLLGQSV
jgi:hypothetical protein